MAKVRSDSIREQIEEAEQLALAPGAARAAKTRGRLVDEGEDALRTAYQRDRDRILHAKAFRRLAHKTQVFLAPEGDHYRVRLTHTLEVTQVARTIARALRLNEDLAEAIALGHDLGHTPFGHLGEEVLSDLLGRPFRHNEQSLRIVDSLESRSGRGGLNLTWEVRDGILNHTWSMPEPATLEGQVARFADRIGYINHDIDDAIRAGVLANDDLPGPTLEVLGATGSARFDAMVSSVIDESLGADRVAMEGEVLDALLETRRFLFERVYLRPELAPEHERVRVIVRALWEHYLRHAEELPEDESGSHDLEVRVTDYIAGMTDRFARRDYERIRPAG
ncbi:MAG: deoxyguanosinetriphosphate triphosphohydrolase [Gaiellales bacterium]